MFRSIAIVAAALFLTACATQSYENKAQPAPQTYKQYESKPAQQDGGYPYGYRYQ